MRLGTVEIDGNAQVVAGLDERRGLLLGQAIGQDDLTLLTVIREATTWIPAITEAMQQLSSSQFLIDLETAIWLPPIPRPGKVCCIAMNNSASNARKISAPDHPAFFLKPASSLSGHKQPINVRPYYGSLHPEPELAVVIGTHTQAVTPDSALDHVFGYTILNDITSNEMRAQDMFHYYALYQKDEGSLELERREQHVSYAARYKGSDGFGPIGPWIVEKSSISNPHNLDVLCTVDDEVIARDSTRYYNYRVEEVVSFISHYHTLNPGDIISMGTAFRPSKGSDRSLHSANLQNVQGNVAVSISEIGELVNPVVQVPSEFDPKTSWRLA